MISFDQVLLLEEKVESAVKKIEQLNAENAALRSKCAELSNALNAKSEQFSSFQSDQSKIEEGILKALSRLSAVENVVLQAANSAAAQSPSNTVPSAAVENAEPSVSNPNPDTVHNVEPSFDSMNVSEPSVPPVEKPQPVQEQVFDVPPVSEPAAPEVGFEFGDSDASGAEPAAPGQSQPMFDIF